MATYPQIPLGPYRPDLGDTNPGILRTLLNAKCKPDVNGVAYGPLESLLVPSTATALADYPKGHLIAVTSGGAYQQFICTTTNIYQLSSSGVPSSIGSGYNLPSGDRWGTCQFGKYAIFTNTADGMLAYDIELGGSVTAISGAPAARWAKVIFDTLFAGDCDGDNKLLRNSDFDHTNWTGGVSGYQEEADGRELMGVAEVADGVAILLQRDIIRVLNRQAGSLLFTQRLLENARGAVNPQCIVPVGSYVYYVDVDGFWRVSPNGSEPIGEAKVNDWFIGQIGTNGLDSIEGAYDPINKLVRWRYSDGNDDNIFTDGIDYDIAANEFVPNDVTTTALFTSATPGYTMEELDAVGTMEELPVSLDDRRWFGGTKQLAGLDGDLKIGYFTGTALAATFETSILPAPRSMALNRATLVTDAANATLSVGQSDRLSASLSYTTAASIRSGDGTTPLGARGKNLTLKVAVAAGESWTYMRGVDALEMQAGGA